jgi:hypothetical protein
MSNILLNNDSGIYYWLITSMYGKCIPDKETIYNIVKNVDDPEYKGAILCFVTYIGESDEYGCEYSVCIESTLRECNSVDLLVDNALKISKVKSNTIKIVKNKIVNTMMSVEYKYHLEGLLIAIYSKIEDNDFNIKYFF